jgi:hypothetical protein
MKKKLISSMFLFGIIVTSFSNYLVLGLNAAEMDERIEYVAKNSFKFWNAEPGVEYKKDEIVILGLEKKKVIQNFTANGDDNWWNAPSLFELVEVSTPENDVIEIEVVVGTLSNEDILSMYIDEENDVTLADVDNKVVIKNISEDELSNEYQRGYSISSYFKFAGWVNNEEGLTLSLDPTAYVRNSTTGLNDGWNALKNTRSGFGAQPNFYRNISKINDQYACHYHAWGGIARSKPRWNLDLWRPDVGYAAVVRANCNP